jgi:hypothetical protein
MQTLKTRLSVVSMRTLNGVAVVAVYNSLK